MEKKEKIKRFFTRMKILKHNFKITLILIFLSSIYFLIMGIAMSRSIDDLFEFKHQIDDRCDNGTCEIRFKIHQDVKGPFYIYIQYDNFFLNHRKVMLSVSNS